MNVRRFFVAAAAVVFAFAFFAGSSANISASGGEDEHGYDNSTVIEICVNGQTMRLPAIEAAKRGFIRLGFDGPIYGGGFPATEGRCPVEPTIAPTAAPTVVAPTTAPTVQATVEVPTTVPTGVPTQSIVTVEPTVTPTQSVIAEDPTTTVTPTQSVIAEDPTTAPTVVPTTTPTVEPTTNEPTEAPVTPEPTVAPSSDVSDVPTTAPVVAVPSRGGTDDGHDAFVPPIGGGGHTGIVTTMPTAGSGDADSGDNSAYVLLVLAAVLVVGGFALRCRQR